VARFTALRDGDRYPEQRAIKACSPQWRACGSTAGRTMDLYSEIVARTALGPAEHLSPVIIPLLDGFAIGLGLIIAVGPQGLFVLRQGLARQHLHVVCLLCSLSDVALISVSIAGTVLLSEVPGLSQTIALGGVVFLLWYGFDRIRLAAVPPAPVMAGVRAQSWRMAAVSCLAVTWLNPAVYSDMLVVGGLAGRHAAADRFAFGLGACSASVVFFCALGYGARLLAPMFGSPSAGRTLELVSGLAMWVLALNLLASLALP
jgi:L-lysine exporter family protein LysE/ArgO